MLNAKLAGQFGIFSNGSRRLILFSPQVFQLVFQRINGCPGVRDRTTKLNLAHFFRFFHDTIER